MSSHHRNAGLPSWTRPQFGRAPQRTLDPIALRSDGAGAAVPTTPPKAPVTIQFLQDQVSTHTPPLPVFCRVGSASCMLILWTARRHVGCQPGYSSPECGWVYQMSPSNLPQSPATSHSMHPPARQESHFPIQCLHRRRQCIRAMRVTVRWLVELAGRCCAFGPSLFSCEESCPRTRPLTRTSAHSPHPPCHLLRCFSTAQYLAPLQESSTS